MARRADHTREQLKTLILEAAWKLVGQGGFEALGARAIAAEIGYAPGTIYNLFESMDALSLQINARTLDELHGILNSTKCSDPSKSVEDNLKTMALLYADFAHRRHPHWLMLFNNISDRQRPASPWYQEKIDRLFDPLEKLLGPLFTARQDRQRKIAARTLWASVHGLCILQETGKIPVVGGREAGEEMFACLIDNFIVGLKEK